MKVDCGICYRSFFVEIMFSTVSCVKSSKSCIFTQRVPGLLCEIHEIVVFYTTLYGYDCVK